jgi:hypothetical protein
MRCCASITQEHGALLIFDEVMTGFRVALGGAQERFGIAPDLTTLGKVIGGGLPVGAYGGRRELMEMVAPAGPVYQAGTLSGNPLAMAAGIAQLLHLREARPYAELEERARRLLEGVADAARRAGVPFWGDATGAMFGWHLRRRARARLRYCCPRRPRAVPPLPHGVPAPRRVPAGVTIRGRVPVHGAHGRTGGRQHRADRRCAGRGGAMRLAMLLAVALTVTACRPGEPGTRLPTRPVPPSGTLPSTEPTVSVGITVDSAAVVIGATSDFEIRGAGGDVLGRGRAGDTWTFTADAEGRISGRGPGGASQPRATSVRVVPARTGALTIGSRQYRGEALIVSRGSGRVTAINVVDLEAYLLGVVPREIGRLPAAQIEAMKAQAVAARTYAVGNLGGRQSRGFDFYATVMDQVYGGVQDEDSIVSRAVRETRGEI